MQLSIKANTTYDISRSELGHPFRNDFAVCKHLFGLGVLVMNDYDRNLLKNDALQGSCVNMKHGMKCFFVSDSADSGGLGNQSCRNLSHVNPVNLVNV